MKLKLTILIAFCLICGMSFGQDFEYDLTSVKTIDNQIIEEQYSTETMSSADRLLVVQTPIKKKGKEFYSKKEWQKIKKQLKKNKKRASKQNIHAYKKMDTIYLDIPNHRNDRTKESRLSAW
ncbi:hypothetical protein [Aquimarina aquimarini]|uniref:hypothetical protein n=1 Tax=Aquimarina aquimarini TaxID=1191734 RepID=UPI00131F2B81|nr:hypothetical protein [Aquimarina aquimarini]